MADKLNELAWTGFTRKYKLELEDGTLVKALGRLDKTSESALDLRRAALEEVVDQVKKQAATQAKRKKDLGDKVFGEVRSKLDELMALAEKLLKEVDAKARSGDDDEDESSPALLTAKMIPLLRELRKGEVTMPALICVAGKNTAVLVMRRAISTARRKLLADAVDAKGGAKYIVGECRYENNTLTFIVQSPAAGLAKRLRQALYEQTDLRLKVVVRGEDGEDRDGEEEEGGAGPEAGHPDAAQVAGYIARRRKLEESLQAALRSQHPEATKLRAVTAFADEKAKAHDYAGAHKGLDTLEKLLAPLARAPGTPPPAAQTTAPQGTQRPGPDAREAAAYVARRRQLDEGLQAALRSQHPESTKLRAVIGHADEKARAHDYASALKGLDMLEKLLAPQATAPVTSSSQDETLGLAFNQRLAALMPSIKEAVASGGEAGQAIKLKLSEASVLARRKEFDAADALLDEVQDLLADLDSEGEELETEDNAQDDAPPPPPPKSRSHVAFTQTRLDWDQARKHVLTQLGKLKGSILQVSAEESDFDAIRGGVDQLYEILEILDERLIDKLDDALNASGDARAALQREASGIVDEYLDFVTTDALMQDIDRNGFIDLDIQSSLVTRLRRMNEALLAN